MFAVSSSPIIQHVFTQNFAKALSSNFSWDNCNYPGEIKKTKGMQNLGGGGVNMVYYGRCANGKFVCFVMTLKI